MSKTPNASLPTPGPWVRLLATAVRCAPTRWKFCKRSILIHKKLSETDPVVLPEGHSWVWAGPKEIEWIDRHPEATSRSAYKRRAARGDSCLCLKNGEEIVGYRWIAWHSGCLYCGFGLRQELRFLPLGPNEAFLYDLYVYEAQRRHGYGVLLIKRMAEILRQRGVDEAFALVDPNNHAVLRLDLRLGYEAVRMVYGFRIRQWNATILGPKAEQPQVQAYLEQLLGSA
jgi:ribosomal protein S18 acetylase RimI-like enzyme